MRLFAERGYDATTVADVAAAAEVSSMRVSRYFPAKEDLVMADEYDPVIVERIRARPAGEPLIRRIGAALVESAQGHSPADRAMLLARVRLGLSVAALRARMWDGQYRSQRYIVEALRGENPDPDRELELWVATGACLAAAAAAIVRSGAIPRRRYPAAVPRPAAARTWRVPRHRVHAAVGLQPRRHVGNRRPGGPGANIQSSK
jgi:AcrR family transcriptional regulator